MSTRPAGGSTDVVIVGAGHNGLVAATMLARAGRSVLVLERRDELGGAAVSAALVPGVGVRVSRYAYLVSLFPAALARELGLDVELRRRRVASYTPYGDTGLLVHGDDDVTRESITRVTDDPGAFAVWQRFYGAIAAVAPRLFATLTEPLPSREQTERLVDDTAVWRILFEDPLSATLERTFSSDLVRGVVLTDATIGTFAPAGDPLLRQNRCFLYHVIGNGTGSWDVPVGGMGALSDALATAACGAGAEIRSGPEAEVVSIDTDGVCAEVTCADGARHQATDVLANVAPAVLSKLLGRAPDGEPPEGSQLKINMLLRRLPRLRDPQVDPADAFAGTFHVNEGYEQMQRAYEQARDGSVPSVPPCELYCHSLTDPSILDERMRSYGAHTLTLFGLHMPARLFAGADTTAVKARAVEATLRSVESVLAEPLEDCLWHAQNGTEYLEALTPAELEAELGMPGGHIFHRDLSWPFAQSLEEEGTWGVETEDPNVWICGAGARRGGGVSGIPGHNAARAVVAARPRH
ncbi:MAG TPA: NAD(P)/FAD-dependent oxidoreductase [Solirubrobacteraceae bacterium]|nr:NAD(P)/FAD-dependent oxidoreductase [Solirubrobacteraceae bacterium]